MSRAHLKPPQIMENRILPLLCRRRRLGKPHYLSQTRNKSRKSNCWTFMSRTPGSSPRMWYVYTATDALSCSMLFVQAGVVSVWDYSSRRQLVCFSPSAWKDAQYNAAIALEEIDEIESSSIVVSAASAAASKRKLRRYDSFTEHCLAHTHVVFLLCSHVISSLQADGSVWGLCECCVIEIVSCGLHPVGFLCG